MSTQHFTVGQRVVYVPNHTKDRYDKSCEHGIVTSIGQLNVFVRYDKQHKDDPGQATSPNDLVYE